MAISMSQEVLHNIGPFDLHLGDTFVLNEVGKLDWVNMHFHPAPPARIGDTIRFVRNQTDLSVTIVITAASPPPEKPKEKSILDKVNAAIDLMRAQNTEIAGIELHPHDHYEVMRLSPPPSLALHDDGGCMTLMGYPYRVSTNVPAGKVKVYPKRGPSVDYESGIISGIGVTRTTSELARAYNRAMLDGDHKAAVRIQDDMLMQEIQKAAQRRMMDQMIGQKLAELPPQEKTVTDENGEPVVKSISSKQIFGLKVPNWWKL